MSADPCSRNQYSSATCARGTRGCTVQHDVPLPTPKPTYCCDNLLKPCGKCGADAWKSLGDHDCGDWEEEQFECTHCGRIIYVELPD